MLLDIHTHTKSNDNAQAIFSLHTHFDTHQEFGLCSMGLHPWYLKESMVEKEIECLKKNSVAPNVVAVGECGLDKVCTTNFQLQQKAFALQINWANEIKKPLILHCVRAHSETIKLLKENKVDVAVVFHGFNNRVDIAHQILEAGFYLSFGKSLWREEIKNVLNEVPMNRFLLETDNAADYTIEQIYQQAALVRNLPLKVLEVQLETTAANIFGQAIIKKV